MEDFSAHLAVNVASVYAAGKEAVAGFDTLPEDAIKTFIYTGNGLNVNPRPPGFTGLLSLGVGKAGGAHLIHAWSTAYLEKGYK